MSSLWGRWIAVVSGGMFAWAPLLVCTLLMFSGCATAPTVLEPGSRPITGYLDYSYDKNSVLFNTNSGYAQTVFFDTFYPFDPSLRYNNAEALVRYELEHKPFTQNGVLMVALADLRKIYAPYFSYTVDFASQQIAVDHHFFRKRVAAGSGSRAPKVEYTKNWVAHQQTTAARSPSLWTTSQKFTARQTSRFTTCMPITVHRLIWFRSRRSPTTAWRLTLNRASVSCAWAVQSTQGIPPDSPPN